MIEGFWRLMLLKENWGLEMIAKEEIKLKVIGWQNKKAFCQQISTFMQIPGSNFCLYSHFCHRSKTSDIKHAKKKVCRAATSPWQRFT